LDEVTVSIKPLLRSFFAAGVAAGLLAACGGDETTGTEDHTPTDFDVLINDQAVSPPYTFVAGETVRVRLKLFNAAGEDLDDVEDSHFAGLTFAPTSLATVTRVADHNYQFDVTGGIEGTGTVTVTYGHEDPPDEYTLTPAAVAVEAAGGGGNQ
jgi:hypothetical protein